MYKIAFDAGHGINTAGKRTPDGEREWAFNNKVAVAFENELKKYKDVELLRTDDRTGKKDVALRERTSQANSWGADIYLSFHQNAFRGKWGNHTGTETYYHKGSVKGKELAEIVNKAVVKAYGLRDRGLKTANLHITRETKMPAILVEGGFMDSNIDIKKLRNDKVLENAGKYIAQAVAEYGNLKLKEVKPVQKKESHSDKLYRVRKDWNDASSQIGAFSKYENAEQYARENKGYKVFDNKGSQLYPKIENTNDDYLVKVTANALNIRQKPNNRAKITGVIRDKGTYTITDTSGKWGKLKSSLGWIHLDYTERI